MSDKITISISRSRLRQMIYAELELEGLNGAGVDNWEGYEETPIIEDEQVEKILEELENNE